MNNKDIELGIDPPKPQEQYKPKINKCKLCLKTIFHGVCVCHHSVVSLYGLYLSYIAINCEDEELSKAGRFAFAYGTNWNFMFQSVFLMLAFIHDIYEWRDKQENPWAKKIAYWRDIIFQSMVVPYTLFVSTMFWTLYLYDRELVFPKVYDVILPWWFNHCVHTNITIIILVETVLQARRYPVNLKLEMILNGVIAIAYAVVYYSIFFFAHRWLYNVFGVLTWWQVVLYQILIWSSSFFFYYIQFPINRMIHGAEPATEKTIVDRVDADVPEKLPEDMTKDETSIANFEISSMQKKQDDGEDPFSSDNWSLKYRSLRDKFENSRL